MCLMTGNACDPRSLRRLEDERFPRGRGATATPAHAGAQPPAILAINTADAANLPGVRCVFTAADLLGGGIRPVPCAMALPRAWCMDQGCRRIDPSPVWG